MCPRNPGWTYQAPFRQNQRSTSIRPLPSPRYEPRPPRPPLPSPRHGPKSGGTTSDPNGVKKIFTWQNYVGNHIVICKISKHERPDKSASGQSKTIKRSYGLVYINKHNEDFTKKLFKLDDSEGVEFRGYGKEKPVASNEQEWENWIDAHVLSHCKEISKKNYCTSNVHNRLAAHINARIAKSRAERERLTAERKLDMDNTKRLCLQRNSEEEYGEESAEEYEEKHEEGEVVWYDAGLEFEME
ncbi:hypothetical protein BDW02DRAFT_575462 [Decorospora gaudefroyi]|uniref:Uncharacterized protein n=1 Tax=Decorospora gaudefroyi TaxID=184978 RepID=A0A6A5KVJ2_9PLEO|nr:hypothetical protein BDW02DRAFT_575462 [Decorospora gaudefroyi]